MKDKFVTLSSLKKFKQKQDIVTTALIQALEVTLEGADADLTTFLNELKNRLDTLGEDLDQHKEEAEEEYAPKDISHNWWKDDFRIEDYVKFTNIGESDKIKEITNKTDLFTIEKTPGKDIIVLNDGAELKGPIQGYVTTTSFNTSIGSLDDAIKDKITASDIKFNNGSILVKDQPLVTPLTDESLVSGINSHTDDIKENLGINDLDTRIGNMKTITDSFKIDGTKISLNNKTLEGYYTVNDATNLSNSLVQEIDKKVSTADVLDNGKIKLDIIPDLSTSKLSDFDSKLADKDFATNTALTSVRNTIPTISQDGKTINFEGNKTFTHQSLDDYKKTEDLEAFISEKGFTKLTSSDIDNKISDFASSTTLGDQIILKLKNDQILNNDGKVDYSKISGTPKSLPASDVSSWAKESTKPTYTASEVGARANTWMPTAEEVGARANDWTPDVEDLPDNIDISKIKNLQTTLNNIPTISDKKITQGDKELSIEGLASEEFVIGKGYQTSTQVESAITSKGYQTANQVETAITQKGYQTANDVETKITSKGYQTSTQVSNSIVQKLKDKEILDTDGNLSINKNKIVGLGSLASKDSLSAFDVGVKIENNVLKVSGNAVTAANVGARDNSWTPTAEEVGVPSWARSATKPTYTASEVGVKLDNGVLKVNNTQITADNVGARSSTWTPSANDLPSISISKISGLQSALDNKLSSSEVMFNSTNKTLQVKNQNISIPEVAFSEVASGSTLKKKAVLRTVANNVEEEFSVADEGDLNTTDALLGADPKFDYAYAGFGLEYNGEDLKGYIAYLDTYFDNVNLKTPKTKLFIRDVLKGEGVSTTTAYYFDATKRQNSMAVGHFILSTKKPTLKGSTNKYYYTSAEFHTGSPVIFNNEDQTQTYNQGKDYYSSHNNTPLYIYLEITKTYEVNSGEGTYSDIEEVSDYLYYPVYKYCMIESGSDIRARLSVIEYLLMQYQFVSPEVLFASMANAGLTVDKIPAFASTNFSWVDNVKFEILQNSTDTTALGQSANNIENKAVHMVNKEITYDNDLYKG